MRSLQVQNITPKAAGDYSDLQVCRSAAGWFIGTLYKDGIPGSRDSCYFASPEDAAFALQVLERMYAEWLRLRVGGNAEDLTDLEFSADFSAVLTVCGLDNSDVGYRLHP